jgi:hypothetical protein
MRKMREAHFSHLIDNVRVSVMLRRSGKTISLKHRVFLFNLHLNDGRVARFTSEKVRAYLCRLLYLSTAIS